MFNSNVHIIGGGGLAIDIISCFQNEVNFAGIWDDGMVKGTKLLDIEVLGSISEISSNDKDLFVIAIGNPAIREEIFERTFKNGLRYTTLIHSSSKLYSKETIQIGIGTILMPNTYCTAYCTINQNVMLHIESGIHHQAEIGSHSILMPGSRVTCAAKIGKSSKLFPNSIVAVPNHYNDYFEFT